MSDREKVIKGLDHCNFGGSDPCYEKECPYYQSHDCTDELKNDILTLLKEQEEVVWRNDCKHKEEFVSPSWEAWCNRWKPVKWE